MGHEPLAFAAKRALAAPPGPFFDAAVLTIALSRAAGCGWSLACRLALIIFGVKTAVIAVESVYLPEIIPPAWVPGLLVNGLITAGLLAFAAVWLNQRWASDSELPSTIWPAHLAEVVMENFLYGLVIAWAFPTEVPVPAVVQQH